MSARPVHDIDADVLIAGAGSAGAVLAARLSENPKRKVILLEAGGSDRHPLVGIPAGSYALMGHKKFDWNYPTEPDPSICGRTMTWSGGKLLGGSSSINGMVYVRGQRADYARWAEAGASGWSWDEMLPYFLKAENFQGPESQVHGKQGPLKVGPANERHPLMDDLIAAFVAMGIPRLDEYCAGDQYGVFDIVTTAAGGRRQSTSRTYLEQAKGRANLRIITEAHVDRVLLEGRKAVGLRVLVGNDAREFRATQTIISAGAIGSPAILMRSGVGPASHLGELGIEVTANLPVGHNLQEHCGIGVSKLVDMPTYNSPFGPYTMARDLLKWLVTKKGPMASAAVHVMAGLKSDPDLPEPDLALSIIPLAIKFRKGRPQMHKQPGISVGGNCMRPDSRGEIRLRSWDPRDKPVIDHRLLGDDRDVERLVKLYRFLEEMYATEPLASHVVGSNEPETRLTTDDDIRAFIHETAAIGYHPVGTCPMGGEGAVLDPELRVRGIECLRVVDASVMPRIISGNTNAATIAIAERAVDLIQS